MQPPTELSSNFVHGNYPWTNIIDGRTRRIMPVDIRTYNFNGMVNPALFRPVKTNGSGILSFKYIGDTPIHTVIQGSFSILLRQANLSETAYARIMLRLAAVNPPYMERGQTAGDRGLGISMGGFNPTYPITDFSEYTDWCMPITQQAIDSAMTWPELYVGSDNGFFQAGNTSEELSTIDPNIGPVGPEVLTTKWMDVSEWVDQDRRFLMNFNGVSNRSRVQYKDADGNIRTSTNFFKDTGATCTAPGLQQSRRIYRFPK